MTLCKVKKLGGTFCVHHADVALQTVSQGADENLGHMKNSVSAAFAVFHVAGYLHETQEAHESIMFPDSLVKAMSTLYSCAVRTEQSAAGESTICVDPVTSQCNAMVSRHMLHQQPGTLSTANSRFPSYQTRQTGKQLQTFGFSISVAMWADQ